MTSAVLTKIAKIKDKYDQLDAEISAGLLGVENVDKLKEFSKMQAIISDYARYEQIASEIGAIKECLSEDADPEWTQVCKQEIDALTADLAKLDFGITAALVEKDPKDECNAIIEISGEVGGEEANLFARDLYDMYIHYINSLPGYTVDLIDLDKTALGGYNYISFKVVGPEAYKKFKYESGIHRVQRVPKTEAKGRLHTSTASVMVTPEIKLEDFKLDLNDVEITTAHASGAGGQHINKTSSAIRAVYKPTGLTVFCQSRRSQLQNKEEALRIIASKIKAEKDEAAQLKSSTAKADALGTRDRSEKIRTYNFPQNRITDHRINYSANNLDHVLAGDLDSLIMALSLADLAQQEQGN